MIYYLYLCLTILVTCTNAQVAPTTPGPGESYTEGSICPIAWTADSTGAWTNMTIDLMSGSNMNMSFVTSVALGVDGTDSQLTSLNWTCPSVTPNSAIYFYEVYPAGSRDQASYTTRFTIASSNGTSTPPVFSTQDDGEPIPWGTGYLKSERNDTTTQNCSSLSETTTPPAAQSTEIIHSSMDSTTTRELIATLEMPYASPTAVRGFRTFMAPISAPYQTPTSSGRTAVYNNAAHSFKWPKLIGISWAVGPAIVWCLVI